MPDVIVIGAGLNGLVAGCYLARRGRSVTILEQRASVGGAAVTSELVPGFRAPTLSHALGPVDARVLDALDLAADTADRISPDPWLLTVDADGRAIALGPDLAATQASIGALSRTDASRWPVFLDTLRRVAALMTAIGGEAPPNVTEPAARDWWHLLRLAARARRLGRRDLARAARWLTMPVADLTGEWFESELLRAAIAAHAIFGNPVGPRSAGTGAMLLARMAADPSPVGSGVTWRGGPGAFTEMVADVARRRGADVRTGAHVARVAIDGGRVTGVVLQDGATIEARTVVAAIAPGQALLRLVAPEHLPPSLANDVRLIRTRGVTAKVNLALERLPPRLLPDGGRPAAARVLMAPSLDYLERAHDAAKYGTPSPQPWLEVSIPTVHDPALAPPGHHVMSVCVHVAPRHLRDSSWAAERGALLRTVIRVLDEHLPGLAGSISGSEVITPEDLEEHWGMSGGHIFHGELALDQLWIGRPTPALARYRTPIEGLLLASAGTHPGGGLTGLPGLLAGLTACGLRPTA